MLSNRWHEAKAWLKHVFQARGPHGVHSPFVYHLITRVLRNKEKNPIYSSIEKERKRLRRNSVSIEVDDFGAGSRLRQGSRRVVGEIARTALQPAKHAYALSLLARHANATSILELGTSLGITTAHLQAALPNARVYTVEGSASIASIASQVWSNVALHEIQSTVGAFDAVLDNVLGEIKTIDFVIIDGDHRGDACLQYINRILPYTHVDSVIVVDDIYWSPSMTAAWEACIADERFTLTLDFFDFGVIYQTKGRVKEHFRLARPWL
jgi:predicted O-methyltransferase YrrM